MADFVGMSGFGLRPDFNMNVVIKMGPDTHPFPSEPTEADDVAIERAIAARTNPLLTHKPPRARTLKIDKKKKQQRRSRSTKCRKRAINRAQVLSEELGHHVMLVMVSPSGHVSGFVSSKYQAMPDIKRVYRRTRRLSRHHKRRGAEAISDDDLFEDADYEDSAEAQEVLRKMRREYPTLSISPDSDDEDEDE